MQQIFLSFLILLFSFRPVFSQENNSLPSSANQTAVEKSNKKDNLKSKTDASTATISASPQVSPSAQPQLESSPSATPEESPLPSPSPKSIIHQFFESETNRAATLFTLAVILIFIGFLAGKQANGYTSEDESEE